MSILSPVAYYKILAKSSNLLQQNKLQKNVFFKCSHVWVPLAAVMLNILWLRPSAPSQPFAQSSKNQPLYELSTRLHWPWPMAISNIIHLHSTLQMGRGCIKPLLNGPYHSFHKDADVTGHVSHVTSPFYPWMVCLPFLGWILWKERQCWRGVGWY